MTATCRLTLALLLILSTFAFAADSPFDLVITNGHIVDGTGSPWYSGDVGIRDGRIAAIGNLSAAARKRTVDAKGKVVAPGFIDMLGQSETTILVDPRLPSKIYQGITTEITGEGGSAAPLNDAILPNDRPGYEHYKINPDWRTFRQYFARLEKQGMGINLASYVGATQVRRMVLGDADVQPTPEQLEKMKALVRDAMRDGAVGVSTALEYAPAPMRRPKRLLRWPRKPRSSAESTRPTCATRATAFWKRSTKPFASGARRTFRWRYGISKWRVKPTGDTCPNPSRGSTRRAPKASTSRRTPTPTPRGSTACRRSFHRGRMTAAMQS